MSIAKIEVTKIFYRNHIGCGFQWCISIFDDQSRSMPVARANTFYDATRTVEKLRGGKSISVVWREDHASLSSAPEYIEGTNPESERARDAMRENMRQWGEKYE